MGKKYFNAMPAADTAALKNTLGIADPALSYTAAELITLLNAKADKTGNSRKVVVDNLQHANTGNTTENVVLTKTLPAGSIGINGSFHITALVGETNNANAKTVRVKFNGVVVAQGSTVSCACYQFYAILRNRNAANVQVAMYPASAASGSFASGTSGSVTTFAFDTTQDITVTVTIQNAVGTDTTSLEAFEIIANE